MNHAQFQKVFDGGCSQKISFSMMDWKKMALGVGLGMCASVFAQEAPDGKATFEAFCGACHGADGKGAGNGQFPPLESSPWIEGKADRMTQAVLKGMHGPLNLEMPDGRLLSYNLEMPPQGGTLSDEQLAAVLTYVRSTWGNTESAVTSEMVKTQRAVSKNREEMWTPEELLKIYPLPVDPDLQKMAKIENLLSYGYKGSFKSLAQLRAAKSKNVEEEHAGLLSLINNAGKDGFGIVWEGELNVPADGEYEFFLDSDDGSAVTLAGNEILKLDRIGGIKQPISTKVALKKGAVPVKIEYYEFSGKEHIVFGWKAKDKKTVWLQEMKKQVVPATPALLLVAPAGEAIIYRNFIAGTTPRAIGVGYSEGVNLAMSADNASLDLLWIGKFMDASRHWIARGQGNQPPAGTMVLRVNNGPAFALLENANSPWPQKYDEKLVRHFQGYQLDDHRRPTFNYQMGNVKVADHCTPMKDGLGITRKLDFTVLSGNAPENLYLSLFDGKGVSALDDGKFLVGGVLIISAPGETIVQQGERLLLPLKGKQSIKVNYQWK